MRSTYRRWRRRNNLPEASEIASAKSVTMFRFCIQALLLAAAVLSADSSTTSPVPLSVSSTTAPVPVSGCINTGLEYYWDGNVSAIKTISTVQEYQQQINLTSCPKEDKCFECTSQSMGVMSYSATCANNITNSRNMVCTEIGHCNSTEYLTCSRKLQAITKMQKCRYVEIVNLKIEHGDWEAYCNDSCGSAIFYDEADSEYMCKGCSSYCDNWLKFFLKGVPTITSNKSCPGEATCRIAGKSFGVGADEAADEVSGGSPVMGVRHGSVAAALAAWVAAVTVCLSLAL